MDLRKRWQELVEINHAPAAVEKNIKSAVMKKIT